MPDTIHTRCCIAGGGPAGMMLGLLLARAGVEVVVLEKHADFLRDFRGDTVHPSTLEVIYELGLLEKFLARPHDEAHVVRAAIGGIEMVIADFSYLRTQCKFIAMMPQWEFLDFLRDEAEPYANFRLIMRAEATGLIEEDGFVKGVTVKQPDGEFEVRSDLVIGADGRRSTLRAAAGLVVRDLGAPIDVLWLRMPMMAGDPTESGGRIEAGHFLAMIHRGSYWQCAYVIPKGGSETIRAAGLEKFVAELASVAPLFADRVHTLQSWDDVKLLSVSVDRLEQWWKPGLLCIGDAAHAMSPVGGIGINLAIQDAVAAANLLSAPLANASLPAAQLTLFLALVQQRRLFPTRVTQAAQVAVQNRLLAPILGRERRRPVSVPWFLKLMNFLPWLRAVPAYAIGVGVRPEHVGKSILPVPDRRDGT